MAVDLITNVADQGSTKEEALRNLKKGLEEHLQILEEIAKHIKEGECMEIEETHTQSFHHYHLKM